jgi:hypothetical protein
MLRTALFLLLCAPPALLDFAIPKWNADKNVRIEDAYKYLYQATRGGEHAAPDRESAGKWLASEWRNVPAAAKVDEPTWEPLCPGGEIGRLNLGPFKREGGKMEGLLEAFLASSAEYRTEPQAFLAAWAELGRRLGARRVGRLDYTAWKKLDAEMKKKNYPPIHHSERYSKSRRPAYRILTLAQARRLIPT